MSLICIIEKNLLFLFMHKTYLFYEKTLKSVYIKPISVSVILCEIPLGTHDFT